MFLFGQQSWPPNTPPSIAVDDPSPGFADQQTLSISLSFSAGSSPINPSSFRAYNSGVDVSTSFIVTESGATAEANLNDGMNSFTFYVSGQEGESGEAFLPLFRTYSGMPFNSGTIESMTSSAFDTEINESMYAGAVLQQMQTDYGVNPHNFHEPMKVLTSTEGQNFVMYSSVLQYPQGSKAVGMQNNPDEEVEFVQVVLPLSLTGGQCVRDYNFAIVHNRAQKYIIFDNKDTGDMALELRVDYIDPADPDTWTWTANGEPFNPEEYEIRGIGACAFSLGYMMYTIVSASTIPLTGGLSAPLAFWIGSMALSEIGIFLGCDCDMGHYTRCN